MLPGCQFFPNFLINDVNQNHNIYNLVMRRYEGYEARVSKFALVTIRDLSVWNTPLFGGENNIAKWREEGGGELSILAVSKRGWQGTCAYIFVTVLSLIFAVLPDRRRKICIIIIKR